MGAKAGRDRERIELEHILACLAGALAHLEIVDVRIADRMRTEAEAMDLVEIRAAENVLQEARDRLATFHPQALSKYLVRKGEQDV